jgi:hypothetical protein
LFLLLDYLSLLRFGKAEKSMVARAC